jgi:glycerol uptake facilitator-like aquaporin
VISASLPKRAAAESIGTALLLAAIVGSGIMGEHLAGGNTAIALLANTIATGAALTALILAFGPVSGAHFNPAVTLADAFLGGMPWSEVPVYATAQIAGGLAGVAAANTMFEYPIFFASHRIRTGSAQWFSEFIGAFGLITIILACAKPACAKPACAKQSPSAVAFAVGAWVAAAYWFTASTSFANPAVTLARTLSDTFSGIRPQDAPAFIAAQIVGAACATALFRWMAPE